MNEMLKRKRKLCRCSPLRQRRREEQTQKEEVTVLSKDLAWKTSCLIIILNYNFIGNCAWLQITVSEMRYCFQAKRGVLQHESICAQTCKVWCGAKEDLCWGVQS